MEDARDLTGETVLVQLSSNEGLRLIGVPDEGPFFCKVVAVDEIGIWVENKRFVTVEIKDSRGRFIPEEKQKPAHHTVNVLLPWRIVLTVVKFVDADIRRVASKVLGEEKGGKGQIGFLS